MQPPAALPSTVFSVSLYAAAKADDEADQAEKDVADRSKRLDAQDEGETEFNL